MSKNFTTNLTPPEKNTPAPRLREDEVMAGCDAGVFPWDGWEKHALAQGVAPDIAALGRAVIREAWQHGWLAPYRALCGWRDDGRLMLQLALNAPAFAQHVWSWLLETDGGYWNPKTDSPF